MPESKEYTLTLNRDEMNYILFLTQNTQHLPPDLMASWRMRVKNQPTALEWKTERALENQY